MARPDPPTATYLRRALAVQTPDWMARDFQEASKSIAAGDYAAAVSLLKKVLEDGKDRPVQTKAKAVLDEVEQQAAGRLVRVKQLQDLLVIAGRQRRLGLIHGGDVALPAGGGRILPGPVLRGGGGLRLLVGGFGRLLLLPQGVEGLA